MTFPIDFWTHPKVSRLSDAAFRAFVESNGQSRMRETDGVLEPDDAEFLWKPEVLAELCASHPSRPLMLRDGDDNYVLRDYAEHQFTKADRDDLSQKRADAAAKRWAKHANAEQPHSNPEQTDARKEIGKGIGTGISPSNEGDSARKRAHSIPANFAITDRMRQWAAENVPLVDIDKVLPEFIDYWRGVGKAMKDWEAVWHNGMRKQQGFAQRDQARRGSTRTEQNMAVVAKYAAIEGVEQKGITP
jgi:hypothetical protein